MPPDGLAIGVDLGGTKIAFALVDRQGKTLATHRLPTLPSEGADAVMDRVAQGIQHLLEQTNAPVAGVGIGSPGWLNPQTGVVHNATNLAWAEVPLKAGVQERLKTDVPIWIKKDANASALGELYFGAGRDCNDFVYIALGTGLGGGAVVSGDVVEGGRFAGMEIGHMPFNDGGRLCACGMYGCPEMYASGTGMLAGARQHLSEYPDSVLAAGEITTEAIIQAAHAHDPLALLIMKEASDWMASVMICLMGILDPSLFIIGGGIGHAAWEWLEPGARQALLRRTKPDVYSPVPMVRSQVHSSALGAACVVWHRLERG